MSNTAESGNDLNLFDSPAHLDCESFGSDLEAVLARARGAGVKQITTIGAGRGVEGALEAVALAAGRPGVWATVGVHPHEAVLGLDWSGDASSEPSSELWRDWDEAWAQAEARLSSLALHPKVVAIGEVGLDFHYDHSPRAIQRQLFRRFVRMAKRIDKPLVIHAREAEDEVAAILREEQAQQCGGVIHCFSGDEALAEVGLSLGFFFGLTGVIGFTKAQKLRDVVAALPLDRLVIETDSPYLAPVPYRGKRNEPAYVAEVAKTLARIKGISVEEAARVTTANARRLYRLDEREAIRGQLAYRYGDALYLNVTNRCTLACRFCLKLEGSDVLGVELGLLDEPSAGELLRAAEAELTRGRFDEVVFCGLGEPLLRPDVVAEVGRALKAKGLKVRVNTDGLGELVSGRALLDELVDSVDAFSVSLNAADGRAYARLCPSHYGADAFDAVCAFIRRAVSRYDQVTATVVGHTNVDADAARHLAESLGASFRVR